MKIILLCYMPSQSCFDAGLLENPYLMPLQSPSAYSYLRLNLLKRTKRILIPTALLSQGTLCHFLQHPTQDLGFQPRSENIKNHLFPGRH